MTDASVHDSQELVGLVSEKDNDLKLDSGYVGEDLQKEILANFRILKLMFVQGLFVTFRSPMRTKQKIK